MLLLKQFCRLDYFCWMINKGVLFSHFAWEEKKEKKSKSLSTECGIVRMHHSLLC